MVEIYILQLENHKYYIGRSNNIDARLNSHFDTTTYGSEWTQLHKPVKEVARHSNKSVFDEDRYTIEYMSLYGIENVRGGSFCTVTLPECNMKTIHQMINGARDNCFKCGKHGHFARECKQTPEKLPIWKCSVCNTIFASEKIADEHEEINCVSDDVVCGRCNTVISHGNHSMIGCCINRVFGCLSSLF